MYDVLDHPLYHVLDIITFIEEEVGIQTQGRIMSMWSETPDKKNIKLAIHCIRRPFEEPPVDFTSNGLRIYEYYDSTECQVISEDCILDIVESITINKDDVSLDYFLDEVEKVALKKGFIYISGFYDNEEGILYNIVEPQHLLWHYHLDWDLSWSYQGTEISPGSWFLSLLKEEIFDVFLSACSKKGKNNALFQYLVSHYNDAHMIAQILQPGNRFMQEHRMIRPSICIPVIVDILKLFKTHEHVSVAYLLSKMDLWQDTLVKPCLKQIAKLEQKSGDDPIHCAAIEELSVLESSLGSFIERDTSDEDDDSSVDTEIIRKKSILIEDDISEEEEEESLALSDEDMTETEREDSSDDDDDEDTASEEEEEEEEESTSRPIQTRKKRQMTKREQNGSAEVAEEHSLLSLSQEEQQQTKHHHHHHHHQDSLPPAPSSIGLKRQMTEELPAVVEEVVDLT